MAPALQLLMVEVDYLRTSRRPEFADLPTEVRSLLADAAGSPVAAARPSVTSGFTGAFAALLELEDGRRVFAKAAGAAAPHARVAIPQEVRVLERLEQLELSLSAPVLVGAGTHDAGQDEEWQVLVLEAIDGRMPGIPWTDDEVALVHDACQVLAAVPPEKVAALTTSSLAADVGSDADALTTLDQLADSARDWPPHVHPLCADRMQQVAALAREAETALTGEHLVHCDLRPDNLLVDTSGRLRIVDWNWVTRGPAWTDFVSLWPLMARAGIDVETLAATSPLTRDAAPEAIDAFLAVLAGYFLTHAGNPAPPATLNAIRKHQALLAEVFLDLLARRRGWDV